MVDCAKRDACEGGLATSVYGSQATCIERLSRYCEQRRTSSGDARNLQALATCDANQRAQTCDEWVGTLTPGCGIAGLKPNGGFCRFDSQCASLFCDEYNYRRTRDVCGVCAPAPAEGEPCHSACAYFTGLQCVWDANGNGHCVRPRAQGEACDDMTPCGSGLHCAKAVNALAGTCQAASAKPGEACDDDAGPFCDYRIGAYCDPPAHACALPLVSSKGGQCGQLPSGEYARCENTVACVGTPGAKDGMCIPYVQDGASCTFGPGTVPCFPPAICASGTCQLTGGGLCD